MIPKFPTSRRQGEINKWRESNKTWIIKILRTAVIFLVALLPATLVFADPSVGTPSGQYQVIPILGVTLDQALDPTGIVVEILMKVEQRNDRNGLKVRFNPGPGKFSPWSQKAVIFAIYAASKVAGLTPDSWSVTLAFPYRDVTMYGDSLSAMVGLSVVALAKGDHLPPDRVLTGTITADGHIGVVGGVPYKIDAAYASHFHRVLIPEHYAIADGDWHTPFLMQVSPVGTVSKAYHALIGHPLHSHQIPSASLVARLP